MKSMFDAAAREEILVRIASLREDRRGLWGKMNSCQMVKHCIRFDEWILGVHAPVYYQSFLGKIFGKLALKSTLKDEPMKRNMPSGAAFEVKEKSGDFERDRARWLELIPMYGRYANPGFIHDFFGKMTPEQIGRLAYKHSDHHLRQFGG